MRTPAISRPLHLPTTRLSLWLAVGLSAFGAEGNRRGITLEECIGMALTNNLEVQIERLNPELARYSLRGAYGAYDPTLTLSAGHQFATFPVEIDPAKVGDRAKYELSADDYSPGISGLLPTGLAYTLDVAAERRKTLTFFDAEGKVAAYNRLTNDWVGRAELTLRQPLLRNLWIDAPRQTILINKKNLKIAELGLRQLLLNVVTKVQLAYYDLIYAREQIQLRRKALDLANELLAENQQRVKAGLLTALEQKQAEAQVATAQADLIAAQQVCEERETTLKTLITNDLRSWAEVALEPTDPLLAVPAPFAAEASWDKALSLRPDLQQFRLEIQKRDVLVRYQYNQLFPAADVLGSYGSRSIQSSFGAVADELGGLGNAGYSYGVVVTIPLANIAARNDYRASEVARQRALLELRRIEQAVFSQVLTAGRQTQTSLARVKATRQARTAAEIALGMEQQKLKAGASTFFMVLELQRDLTAARAAEVGALTDYNKALAQLAFSEGSTLEQLGLAVEVK
jgi:HAE1 family hydrophobic/amphiphilic exporter-1